MKAKKLLAAGWRLFLGCFFCQFPLTAIAVVGWTMRGMRGSALKVWWNAGAADASLTAPPEMTQWPNWVLAEAPRGKRDTLGALFCNLRLGFLAMFNIWALTWPAAILWYFGWRYGWDISFNKVYEHAHFGREVSTWGILVFLIAMLYVPIAHARQAVTGDWRAFWHVRSVLRLAWFSPQFLVLSAAYALASLAIMVLVIAPYFAPKFSDESLSDSQIIEALNSYYFWSALIYFPLYVGLHLLSARLYANAVLQGLRRGHLQLHHLHPAELRAFAACGIDAAELFPARRSRALAHAFAPIRLVLVLGLWFVVVSSIYIAQFFNYQPMRHWFNQPLVHLPWIKYVPEHLNSTVQASEN